ncbi:MAG: glycoside hydrolase family 3 N-terminal domain-containing protein [Acidimicrobiales bacterium]
MSERIEQLLADMTTEEKVATVTGSDMWHTRANDRLGIPKMKVTDGPNGARGDGLMGTGAMTACIPSGAALGATWDPALVERLGEVLGDEARAKKAHVLLAPTINLHRSPKGGRNFECYSEDPVLTGRLATAFVEGVQSKGVATTPKHFVGNDSEFERNSIDTQVDERTLREVYLVPFEHAVKDGGAWGVMSAYNRLNGTFCSESEWLLTSVLRDDWGFDGFVVTDWFAARSTVAMADAGLSLEMPGEGKFYGPALLAAIEAGEVATAALDRITLDVLRAMERTGALDGDGDFTEETLDRAEDRAVIRAAAAAGSVLLRNDGILPLDGGSLTKIAMIGPNAFSAKVMGGGSAKVNSYRATSPFDALAERLPGVEVNWEKGSDIDRTTPPLGRPLVDGKVSFAYHDGQDLEGDPVVTLQRSTLEMLAFGPPAEGVSAESFSVRASCTVVPAVDGLHEFRLVQCGRARVLVDGEVVIDATQGDVPSGTAYFGFGSAEIPGPLELRAGVPVEVVVEFSNRDAVLLGGFTVGVVTLVEEDLLGRAETLAATSDIAIVVVGTNDDWETEGRDRDLWELPGDQPELIRRVCAANPRTIVVVNVGAPHDMSWLDAPAAVLSVGFGGQELGDAVVDMLLGDVEPSGRAPTTIGARYEHFAAYPNYPGENSVVRYGEGLFVGHRFHDVMDIEPAVAFGSGLGYTSFSIGAPRGATHAAPGDTITVAVDVTNTGDRSGSEVVQVYVEPIDPSVLRPVRELKAFRKITLEPGATETVTLELDPRAFAYYDVGDQEWESLQAGMPVPAHGDTRHRQTAGWYVDPGRYRIVVGRSSREFAGDLLVTLDGEEAFLDR